MRKGLRPFLLKIVISGRHNPLCTPQSAKPPGMFVTDHREPPVQAHLRPRRLLRIALHCGEQAVPDPTALAMLRHGQNRRTGVRAQAHLEAP